MIITLHVHWIMIITLHVHWIMITGAHGLRQDRLHAVLRAGLAVGAQAQKPRVATPRAGKEKVCPFSILQLSIAVSSLSIATIYS